MTQKKVTRVEGGENENSGNNAAGFTPTDEARSRAKQLRIFAIIAWIAAMGVQAYLIFGILMKPPVNMTFLIIGIVVDLILAVTGSYLWKKSNRLDPASKKEPVKFFVQNQLGAILGVLAFLPMVIMIFMNKDMDGKQKGIAGVIAIAALLLAGVTGVDFNPPSVEEYAEQTQMVERLNEGRNFVYWTKAGTRYHLYSDCSYINTTRTDEIFEGTVAQARELKNISQLCSRCQRQAMEERNISEEDLNAPAEEPATEEEPVFQE